MMLKEILSDCEYRDVQEHTPAQEIDISGIAYDSRQVRGGYIFVAIKGETVDGHNFIHDAVRKGAVVIVYEHENPEIGSWDSGGRHPLSMPDSAGCFIRVENSRKALACISNNFYQRPSEDMMLIGITGTNGKTTTTYILRAILKAWGKHVGLIGTIQYMVGDKVYSALHTTPEAPEFQGLLRDMYSSGCTHVISEVSSHALAQCRVDNAVFQTAVFTNLTRDHLDFHKSMENYFRAKERLFRELLGKKGTAVINIDDPYGRRLYSELRPPAGVSGHEVKAILTYGIQSGADILAVDIENSLKGLTFTLVFRGERYPVVTHLMGIPNAYNILSAVGAAISLDVPWHVILEGIKNTETIAGRFEKVYEGQEFLCILDYAHTEDALERLIATAREILVKNPEPGPQKHPPKIITVFGCGGDRDHGKRPKMGEAATRLSDFVIITSDNPRSEEPMDIIKDIIAGAVRNNYLIEPHRKEAIRKAVEMADENDVVLIAGKGHEDYQEIKGVRHPFSDRDVLKGLIRDRLKMNHAQ
jgi:UDP-N-acetylmuramoyl-L-alanyl-D-glutamate--2,6-diaminopimelate ligase